MKKAWRSHYCVNKQKLNFRGFRAYVVGLEQKKICKRGDTSMYKKGGERARKKPRRSRFFGGAWHTKNRCVHTTSTMSDEISKVTMATINTQIHTVVGYTLSEFTTNPQKQIADLNAKQEFCLTEMHLNHHRGIEKSQKRSEK